jgi:hypothetical protein
MAKLSKVATKVYGDVVDEYGEAIMEEIKNYKKELNNFNVVQQLHLDLLIQASWVLTDLDAWNGGVHMHKQYPYGCGDVYDGIREETGLPLTRDECQKIHEGILFLVRKLSGNHILCANDLLGELIIFG